MNRVEPVKSAEVGPMDICNKCDFNQQTGGSDRICARSAQFLAELTGLIYEDLSVAEDLPAGEEVKTEVGDGETTDVLEDEYSKQVDGIADGFKELATQCSVDRSKYSHGQLQGTISAGQVFTPKFTYTIEEVADLLIPNTKQN